MHDLDTLSRALRRPTVHHARWWMVGYAVNGKALLHAAGPGRNDGSMVELADKGDARWWVVHTRPRCEKRFADLARREGLPHELPLLRSVRRYATQTKHFTKPLFPGYVFTCVAESFTSRLYQGDFVASLLRVPDQTTFLRQMEAVRRVMASGMDVLPAPRLERGTHVRIVGGPLHGVLGIVEDPRSNRGVVVAIDVIQQGVLVHVPESSIEVIEGA